MKFKIKNKEYIVIEANKFNEMKKIINEIYENLTEIENKIKGENDDNKQIQSSMG